MLQATVQNLLFLVAKYKVYFPTKSLYICQVGSDQFEQLYSSVRTQNHDSNCDTYQLENRLTILDKMLTKNPQWKQRSKRLSGPIDHTNPAHCTGNLSLCHRIGCMLELGEQKCIINAYNIGTSTFADEDCNTLSKYQKSLVITRTYLNN